MRITLLADVHVSDSPALSHGVDTQANFGRVIGRVRQLKPDHLVLMGDYSLREPRREDVEWVCSRTKLAEVPFDAIAGNHDDPRDVAEVFGPQAGLIGEHLYYRRDLESARALFLDTSKGYLGEQQIDWLQQNIQGARGPVLVFMHHPPLRAGVPFMDENYPLKDRGGDVYNILFAGGTPIHVFCGHYHNARTICVGAHTVHLCPSTYFQIDPSQEEFAVGHSMPGMRHIELIGDELRTWIEILPKLS